LLISIEVDIGLISQSYVPIGRRNVPCYNGLPGRERGDPERKRLASESSKCLVRCSPVVAHAYPPCFASLHPHLSNVSGTADVHHIHQQPVPIPLECELKPIGPLAWHSTHKHMHIWSNEKVFLVDSFLR
jgi:hypothetical protein